MSKTCFPRENLGENFWTQSTIAIDTSRTRGLSKNEKFALAMAQKAATYLEQANIQAAEYYLRQGLQRIPGNLYCQAYLAVCLAMDEPRFAEGEYLANQLLEENPSRAITHFAVGCVDLQAGRRRKAFRRFKTAHQLAGRDRFLRMKLKKSDPRRSPVLRFLDRGHPLNRFLGRIRAILVSRQMRVIWIVLGVALIAGAVFLLTR